MVQARKPIPYKLPGTASTIPSRPMFHKELGKGPGTAAYGQCNSSNLYKQDGGHPLPYPVTVSQEPVGLVSKSQCFDKGTVHSRNPERTSRSRVQNFPGLQRLETSSSHFQFGLPEMGSTEHRPICISSHISTRPICELEVGSVSSAHGRLHPRLGNISGICVSPLLSNWSVSTTCSESEGRTPCNSDSSLANTNMVSPITDTLHRFPYPIAGSGRPVDTRGQEPSPSSTVTSCVATINSSYQTGGLSSQTRTSSSQLGGKTPQVHTPQPGTSGVAVVLNDRGSVNPLSPSLSDVLDFFTTQFHEGNEYRTINIYRSDLSAVLPLIDGHKAGSHPLVCQLLKGVYHLRPPQSRYASTWQVNHLVDFISSLGPNAELSIKLLSYKLVGLLALSAPDRASGLAVRDLRFSFFHPEGVDKNVKPVENLKRCFHASFPDNDLSCICSCHREYENRAVSWRPKDSSNPNKLLLSFINPHNSVSRLGLAYVPLCLGTWALTGTSNGPLTIFV